MDIEELKDVDGVIWRPETELENPIQLQTYMADFKSSGHQLLLLDLATKQWLSSSEIGVVMWIYKELNNTGANLYLLATSSFILQTIEVTGINHLMPVFDSLESALDTIQS